MYDLSSSMATNISWKGEVKQNQSTLFISFDKTNNGGFPCSLCYFPLKSMLIKTYLALLSCFFLIAITNRKGIDFKGMGQVTRSAGEPCLRNHQAHGVMVRRQSDWCGWGDVVLSCGPCLPCPLRHTAALRPLPAPSLLSPEQLLLIQSPGWSCSLAEAHHMILVQQQRHLGNDFWFLSTFFLIRSF